MPTPPKKPAKKAPEVREDASTLAFRIVAEAPTSRLGARPRSQPLATVPNKQGVKLRQRKKNAANQGRRIGVAWKIDTAPPSPMVRAGAPALKLCEGRVSFTVRYPNRG